MQILSSFAKIDLQVIELSLPIDSEYCNCIFASMDHPVIITDFIYWLSINLHQNIPNFHLCQPCWRVCIHKQDNHARLVIHAS